MYVIKSFCKLHLGFYFYNIIECSMYFAIPINLTNLLQSEMSVVICNACLSFINYIIKHI